MPPRILRFVTPVLGSLFLLNAAPLPAGELKPGDLVAICGDSITEQKLYSVYMEDYLLMCQPQPDLQTLQAGWSGEATWGFLNRLKNDVLPFKPTVATTCYGMNDGGYDVLAPDRAAKFREATEGIVRLFQENGVRFLVLGSPGAVDTDSYRKDATVYNKTLGELTAIAREIAEKNNVTFANVHEVMLDVMAKAKAKYGSKYQVAGGDGVHPGPNGHLIMAYAFLKALGCDGAIGTITYDFAAGKAEATAGHDIQGVKDGTVTVKSTKYPFCFYGDPASPGSTSGVIEFLPFNQDLNRFLLVVKNAPAGKLKVTWGAKSKEFSSDQLAQGVNLAAEFLDNPFSRPFAKAEEAIRAQQIFETAATKSLLHSLLELRAKVPNHDSFYDELSAMTLKKAGEIRAEARAAIVPVTHTIAITPAA